jgi:hypothetical protein
VTGHRNASVIATQAMVDHRRLRRQIVVQWARCPDCGSTIMRRLEIQYVSKWEVATEAPPVDQSRESA